MATYQEQLEKARESKVAKAMVAYVELGKINDVMVILERDGIIKQEDRFVFLKAYMNKHPEINRALEASAASSGDKHEPK